MSIELVVGLGNIGRRYRDTRHNAGFRVIDELYRRHQDSEWSTRPLADVASTRVLPRLIVAKPRTLMNRSGAAVEWLLEHLDLDVSRLLVVVDDVDLPLGSLRLRRSGGPGTHNGLRDLCRCVGSGFARLRIGVQGSDPWDDLAAYVVSPFEPDEESRLAGLVGDASDAVEAALSYGVETAMSRFNRVGFEKPEKPYE
jgi:PTH1 family peptidyl-tRNA hydrolase